jgi:glycosyltransferase involved in cell wall biosynthesis
MKINVIIPVFNEKKTIVNLYKKVQRIKGYNKKIIIVDDGSTDGSREIIKNRISSRNVKFYFHKKNLGKGAAIKTALKSLNGDIVIIQDADLEYNPNDYHKLLRPFKNKEIKVVYGSRVLNKKRYSFKFSLATNFRVFANFVLTIFSNFVNRQKLTDAHTCYKVFRISVFKKLNLKENDFAFCPEVTTKLSNKKIKIFEVPISYKGRSYNEGKKIGIYDAIRVIAVIIKNKFNYN